MNFIIDLILTMIIFTLPFYLFRYIKGAPIKRWIAMLVVVVYSVLIHCVLLTAIYGEVPKNNPIPLLWVFVSIYYLTAKKPYFMLPKKPHSPQQTNIVLKDNTTNKNTNTQLTIYDIMNQTVNAENNIEQTSTYQKRYNTVKIIMLFAIIALISCCGYLSNQNYQLKNDLASMTKEKNYWLDTADLFAEENCSLQTQVDFMNDSIVFCTETGSKYHTYDCHYWHNGNGFYCFNVEYAQYLGYTPCKICNPPQ